jgi:hypothetical protein
MSSAARRYLRFTALLVAFYGLPSSADAQVATGSWLSVRSGPAFIQLEPQPQGGVVAELPQATLLQASQFRDGWYYVRLPKRGSELADRWGWIAGSSVLPSAPPPPVRITNDAPEGAAAAATSTPAVTKQASREKTQNRSAWASIGRALNPMNWFRRRQVSASRVQGSAGIR